MAVLALKLVADGTGSVRQMAAHRGSLLKRLECLLESPTEIAAFQRPDAVVHRLKELATSLYQVRAQYRGKQHRFTSVVWAHAMLDGEWTSFKKVTPITQAEEHDLIKGLMQEYARPEEVSSSALAT